MKHIHLDLHVNTHVLHSIIIASLAVVTIAGVEFINLNGALAYEKQSLNSLIENKKYIANNEATYNNSLAIADTELDVYSDEVELNSADELDEEVLEEKARMKKSLIRIMKHKNGKKIQSKIHSLDAERKAEIIERLELKIEEITELAPKEKKKMAKLHGKLLALKELFQ